jgi:hypothetical protein
LQGHGFAVTNRDREFATDDAQQTRILDFWSSDESAVEEAISPRPFRSAPISGIGLNAPLRYTLQRRAEFVYFGFVSYLPEDTHLENALRYRDRELASPDVQLADSRPSK